MKSEQSNNEILELLSLMRKGELTADQRDKLLSAARTDQFVADALEGFGMLDETALDQHLSRLDSRIGSLTEQSAPGRSRPLWHWMAAAAAVLLLVISGTLIMRDSSVEPEFAILEETSRDNAADAVAVDAAPIQENEPVPVEDQSAAQGADLIAPAAQPKNKLIQPQSEAQLVIRDADASDGNVIVDGIQLRQEALKEGGTPAAQPPIVIEEVPASSDDTSEQMAADQESDAGARAAVADMAQDEPQILGVIKDQNGEPLIGANIQLKGSQIYANTNISGNFILPVPQEARPALAEPTLIVSYTGYETVEQAAQPGENVEITMTEGLISLEEAVVTGYSAKKARTADAQSARALAQPVEGEKSYKRYLKKNMNMPRAASEASIKGNVVLEFDVDADGRPVNVRVIQSLGHGCDEEAVRLLTEGGDWDISSAQVAIGRLTVTF